MIAVAKESIDYMRDAELRHRALQLANGFPEAPDAIVERASAYLAFLNGGEVSNDRA